MTDSLLADTYKTLLDHTRDAILVFQNDKIVYSNKTALKLTKRSAEELADMTLKELLVSTKNNPDIVEQQLKQFHETHAGQLTAYITSSEQNDVFCEINFKANEWQGESACLVTLYDITEKSDQEVIQKVLYEISEAATYTSDLNTLYEQVHEIIHPLIPAENFVIALYNVEKYEIMVPYRVDINQPDKGQSSEPQRAGDGIIEFLLRKGRASHLTGRQLQRMIHQRRITYPEPYFTEWIGVPLMTKDEAVVGALAMYTYDEAIHFGERELNILSFISTQIARAIDKKRAEEEILESEEKYRLLVENVYDAIMVIQDNRFVFFNNQLLEMLDFTRIEMSVKEFVEITTEDSWSLYEKVIYHELPNDEVPRYETTLKRKDGTILEVEANQTKILYRGKAAMFAVVRDITERRRFMQMLEEDRNLMRTLIDTIPDHIYMKDDKGRYILANEAYVQFTGHKKADDLISKTDAQLFKKSDPRNRDSIDQEFYKSPDKSVTLVERIIFLDSNPMWLLTTKVPLYDTLRQPIATISISRDITEQKEYETKLKESYEKLTNAQDEILELERNNTALAVAVAANHELNQPLMVMSGYLQMLHSSLGDEKLTLEQKEYIHFRQDAFKRIQDILQKYREAQTVHFEKYMGTMPMAIFGQKK